MELLPLYIGEIRELKQPRRRQQQERHKFACLTTKNSSFARFAHALFIFFTFCRRSCSLHNVKGPVLQLCGRRGHIMTNVQFFFLSLKCWFQFNSRIVGTHFASVMTLNNWEMIAEMRSYIFRWRFRRRRRRFCLSSLLGKDDGDSSDDARKRSDWLNVEN